MIVTPAGSLPLNFEETAQSEVAYVRPSLWPSCWFSPLLSLLFNLDIYSSEKQSVIFSHPCMTTLAVVSVSNSTVWGSKGKIQILHTLDISSSVVFIGVVPQFPCHVTYAWPCT